MDNKIVPIILKIDYRAITQNAEDEALLTLERGVDLWDKLTED